MVSILTRMSQGNPGDLTRPTAPNTVEAQIAVVATPFTTYGAPVKFSGNNVVPIAGGEAASAIIGFLVRPFPIQGANASDPLGTSVPPKAGPVDVLKRGYISVKCANGTPAVNGTVYVRIANPTGPIPLGSIEATSIPSTNVAVPGNTYFTGAQDSNGNVEVAYNI